MNLEILILTILLATDDSALSEIVKYFHLDLCDFPGPPCPPGASNHPQMPPGSTPPPRHPPVGLAQAQSNNSNNNNDLCPEELQRLVDTWNPKQPCLFTHSFRLRAQRATRGRTRSAEGVRMDLRVFHIED